MPDTPTRPNERPFSVIRAGKESGMPRGFNYELLWAKDTQTLWIQTPSGKVKVGGPGFLGQDEKVKADDTDPEAGYLSDKVDDTTIKVNTTDHKIYVVDDSSIQKVRWLEDGTEKGIRSAANFKPTSTVSVSVTDNNTDNRVDIELSTPDDRSNQRVKVLVGGTEIGTRPTINFVPDGSVTITGADSDTNNRVDITISSTGGGSSTDEKVKTDVADPTAGYLDSKVDNVTIKANTTTHKIYAADATTSSKGVVRLAGHLSGTADYPTVVDNTSNQRVRVLNNGTLIGTRRAINFQTGTGISLNIADNPTYDRVDVQITNTGGGGGGTDEKVKADSADPTAGYLNQKVDGTTISVNTSTHKMFVVSDSTIQKVNLLQDYSWYATSSNLNFVAGPGIGISISDDPYMGVANITITNTGSASADEKVKADAFDPTAGYLDSKVDNSTIKVNTATHKLYIPNNSSIQRVNVGQNGIVYSTRGTLNFAPNTWTTWTVSDNSGSDRADIILVPRVSVLNNGTVIGTRPQINFVPTNTSQLSIADDSGNNRVNISVSPKVSPSGSIVETANGLALADDNNAGTDRYYTTNSYGARVWVPKPFTDIKTQAVLNAAVNITANGAPGQTVDAGDPYPVFRQVLLPGRWYIIFHIEAEFGITGGTSGTGQLLFGIYKREDTTDTLLVNVRLAKIQLPGSMTTPRMLFSVDKSIFLETTYNGFSDDIRIPPSGVPDRVQGTVIFIRAYRTTSGSVSSIDLSQITSTSTIDAARMS